jgi:hypothetical protein
MPYELYIDKRLTGRFDSSEEALEHAREAVKSRSDCEPEIIDTATGRAFEPAASQRWRDDLANKVGF